MRNKILTSVSCLSDLWVAFFFVFWVHRKKKKKNSVLCFNKRAVTFISLKRIEIKVFLLLNLLSHIFFLLLRERFFDFECVYENLLMLVFTETTNLPFCSDTSTTNRSIHAQPSFWEISSVWWKDFDSFLHDSLLWSDVSAYKETKKYTAHNITVVWKRAVES